MQLEKWLKISNSKQNNPIQSYNFKEQVIAIQKQTKIPQKYNFYIISLMRCKNSK